MVVSNLGSIVLALPSAVGGADTTANVAHEVRLLALANTLSRLAVGPLADALAPVAARRADGVWAFSRARATSRVAFVLASAALLAATAAWTAGTVRTQEAVWPLSVGTGVAYGSVFTVLCVPFLSSNVQQTADSRTTSFQARRPLVDLRARQPRAQLRHHLVRRVRRHDALLVPVRVRRGRARRAGRGCLQGRRLLARDVLDLGRDIARRVRGCVGAVEAVEGAGVICGASCFRC